METRSPAVSPKVVAQIFITQNEKVIAGILFIPNLSRRGEEKQPGVPYISPAT